MSPWVDGDRLDSTNLNSKFPSGLAFNVTDSTYGALGDGITDDTDAIQSAIDAANTAGGGVVYFPAGIYVVSDSLALASSVTLLGVQPESNVIEADPSRGSVIRVVNYAALAGNPIIDVSGTLWAAVRNLKIMVVNSDPTLNTVMAIADPSSDASFLLIEGNHFQWFGGPVIKLFGGVNWIRQNRANNSNSHFIWLANDGSGGSSDNFVLYNESGAHQSNGVGDIGDAVRIDGGAHNTVALNHLYNFYSGVRLTGIAAASNQIVNNRCEKHTVSGILLDANPNEPRENQLVGNTCFNNGTGTAGAGILISQGIRNQVVGNFCYQDVAASGSTNQAFGIQLVNATENQIEGNYCYRNQVDNVRISTSSRNTIQGNFVYLAQQWGVLIQTTSNANAVRNNYIYDNGQATANTYDGVLLNTTCDDNVIEGNTVTGTQHKQAINVNTSNCNRTRLLNNTLKGGWTTAGIRDVGTATERRGNRLTVGAISGQVALVNGTATVSTAEVLTTDNIILTRMSGLGTTRGLLAAGTITGSTSFVVNSTDLAGTLSADDDSVVFWELVH